MTAAGREERLRSLLERRFAPVELEIEDESHLHAGHAGAAGGLGHFRVRIVAEAFRGIRPLDRHRQIYGALGALLETDIHALTIDARAPSDA